MKYLYQLFITLFPMGIKIASLFSPKAKLWVEGRKNILEKIATELTDEKNPRIWIHCASLGEFEQGRPIIESLKASHPNYKIILTFFSPSGYEVRKDYKGANYIFYLPSDSKKNAKRFVELVNPSLVIFIKYEFWHNYIEQVHNRKIPLILVSAIFRKGQVFFKPTGTFYRNMLKRFTHIFLQDHNSKNLLDNIDIQNCTIAGDTRFDRVLDIATLWSPIPYIDNFVTHFPTLIAGSTWPEDEHKLAHFINSHLDIKTIIAPHEITDDHINNLIKIFPSAIKYSMIASDKSILESSNIMIIDNIGMLNKLYKYATVTYVGGAWGDNGIHNILEAAVYGKPVMFGPNHQKSVEAQALIENNGGFDAGSSHDLEKKLTDLFANKELCTKMSSNAYDYVYSNKGATTKIMKYLNSILLK